MKYDQLRLDRQICHRLYMATNAVQRVYRPLLEALDLTYPQYVVMMALWQSDQVTIQQLLDQTRIDGGAMTQIMKKMAAKGLLQLVPDQDDKRKKIVSLTTAGRELRDEAVKIPEQIHCAFPSVSEQEAGQLIALLDKVNAELG